jgi:signal transduction histidine kinase
MGLLRTHGIFPLLLGSDGFIESLILEHNQREPEVIRRYRLIQAFHKLGLILGLCYALFYFLIGFGLAGVILTLTVMGMGLTWPLLLHKRSPELVGNFFSFTIAAALIVMTPLQGGIYSPSICWFIAPPLVCLLIAGIRPALLWSVLSVGAITIFAVLDNRGVKFPIRYEPGMQEWINFAGYVGLIVFSLAIAVIIERNRLAAFEQVQTSINDLAAVNDKLMRVQQQRDELFSVVAHDLNTPLATIMGTASILQEGLAEDNAEVRKLSRTTMAAAKRMQFMLEQVLNLKALEDDKLSLRPEKVDLDQFVREHLEIHQVNAEAKRIMMVVETGEQAMAYIDRRALMHIAQNLISNALKYTYAGKRIYIRVRSVAGKSILEVEDEGLGIPEEERSRLFRRFSRLSTTPTGRESSHGLGLYIVRRFTEASGGKVVCAPYRGDKGAVFVVELPQPK